MSAAPAFRYRALRGDGRIIAGQLDAASESDALAQIRRSGNTPVELRLITGAAATAPPGEGISRRNSAISRAVIAELAVLLKAGLPLDRALALAVGNIDDPATAEAMGMLLSAVREGAPISRAMLDNPALFSPGEAAMAEAGEANGKLGEAMERLSKMLEQAAELRRLVITSMIYPIALSVISVGVILMMLLFVVPQFERLLDNSQAELPFASMAVIAASQFLRAYGLWLLAGLVVIGLALRNVLARPSSRIRFDQTMLRLPLVGDLVRRIETARFSHTLGALLEGGVPLPNALALAQRTVGNTAIAAAIATIAEGVREGGGLSAPLAATGMLPHLAIGFIRTGEETSQLALMLSRLAVVLDRDVRTRLERLVAILTPTITIVLGTAVAVIIAAVMSAILGFNELAVSQ
ncbi:type II secretion system F family protein [Novosphingobium sp.]|uniref:type II secretion system F family protein n=1 Tax=Novosphingobium sp. TaxID=1874826 RepID=UPI001DB38C2C|nr:type II secretion system F family protein [Novosphingobium sp.]MBX9664012.1 type II secretion system F family protein [Novosphingobium sp.]